MTESHPKTVSRADRNEPAFGQKVVVRANKTCVSVTVERGWPCQLEAQDARDIAHAILRAADSLEGKR